MSEPEPFTEPFPEFEVDPTDNQPAESAEGTASARPAFVRRHRRSRHTARSEDIEEFRRVFLGVQEEVNSPELDAAFNEARMSLTGNNGANNPNAATPSGGTTPNSGAGLFNFFDNNASNAAAGGGTPTPRSASTPPTPTATSGGANNGAPTGIAPQAPNIPQNAGHQMDLNYLYSMVLELSEVLRNNRDMTRGIMHGAEELMRRSEAEDAPPNIQEANGEITAARIADLERSLAKEKRRVEYYKRESSENWKLIHEYEDAVGKMTEGIRNYCCNNESHFLAQKRHYNNLLQAERDAHLESRLERDHWHAQTMKCAGMIRHAYRLRCEEEELPIRVVAGLQNEVRCLRNAIGLDPERPEEEYGWEILKHAPPGVD